MSTIQGVAGPIKGEHRKFEEYRFCKKIKNFATCLSGRFDRSV